MLNIISLIQFVFLVKAACARIQKPVTCKIRIYESIEKTVAYAKRLEKAGAKVIFFFKLNKNKFDVLFFFNF